MSYLPHTDQEIRAMLDRLGIKDVGELFHDVPASKRFPPLNLPDGKSQLEVAAMLETMSQKNVPGGKKAFFLGAGIYNHYIPPVVDHIIRRGEFLTSYTPYQPEVSQGTLQAIFEYQTMAAALTGMEVSNASHYDGATSLAEAVIMAIGVGRGKRTRIVLCSGINPEYRAVVRTYTQGMGLDIVGDEACHVDADSLITKIDENTAMVAVAYPDFFGQIHDIRRVVDAAHAKNALAVVVTDPISLGMLTPPGELGADIVTAEGQGLGLAMSFGGPYLGMFTTREEHVRKMAGRLIGETVDKDGNTGYVLTLATREQHIRRERASSNICSNQGLMATATAVYMATMGKAGMRQVAELCYHKSHYAAAEIAKIPGYSVDLTKPFVKEFVVSCPKPVDAINEALLEKYDIIGGYNLQKDYPERVNQMLIAVTEMNTKAQIDLLVTALKEVAK